MVFIPHFKFSQSGLRTCRASELVGPLEGKTRADSERSSGQPFAGAQGFGSRVETQSTPDAGIQAEKSWTVFKYGHGLHNLWQSHFGVERPFAIYFDVHQFVGFDPQPYEGEIRRGPSDRSRRQAESGPSIPLSPWPVSQGFGDPQHFLVFRRQRVLSKRSSKDLEGSLVVFLPV